jgi:hypothetical protein
MNIYTKKINDTTYTVTLFNAVTGLSLARKLSSILASAQNLDISSAVDKLIEYDSDISLTLELLSNTLVDGQAIERENFNKLFTGKLGEYVEVLVFVLEVNFKDFFCTIKLQMEKLKMQPDPKSQEENSLN